MEYVRKHLPKGMLTSLIDEPLDALARLMGRRRQPCTVGLALSGGAARGIAHIGVLAVLLEAGIVPDIVVGTSAGAAVGALFCRGWSPEQILRLARGLGILEFGRPAIRRPGVFDSSRLEKLFRDLVGTLTFDDLSIPFAAVSCDLLTGEQVVFREGDLALAVRASCSMPGLFTPVRCEGHLLTDGGLVRHLPASVARDMGADYVIGVDVNPREVPKIVPRNPFDVLMHAYYIVLHHSSVGPADRPDCLISPDTESFDWLRFSSQADGLFDAGREAAYAVLDSLRQELEGIR